MSDHLTAAERKNIKTGGRLIDLIAALKESQRIAPQRTTPTTRRSPMHDEHEGTKEAAPPEENAAGGSPGDSAPIEQSTSVANPYADGATVGSDEGDQADSPAGDDDEETA